MDAIVVIGTRWKRSKTILTINTLNLLTSSCCCSLIFFSIKLSIIVAVAVFIIQSAHAHILKYLNTMIFTITHQYVTIWHNSNTFKTFKFCITRSPWTECSQEATIRMKDLYTIIARISNTNKSLIINGYTSVMQNINRKFKNYVKILSCNQFALYISYLFFYNLKLHFYTQTQLNFLPILNTFIYLDA